MLALLVFTVLLMMTALVLIGAAKKRQVVRVPVTIRQRSVRRRNY
jgi:hypothetical protein